MYASAGLLKSDEAIALVTNQKDLNMFKKLLFPAMILSVSLAQVSFAEDQCKEDKDCKNGEVCILALTPPVCKPPQAAGAPCKRDVVCASKKCDIPTGKEAGICK
jgi:hypothetical protein